MPSRHEPLGNVVIEAWAQRRPIVAAAAAGPAGLIRDGATGLLAPVNDARGLAAALRRVLESRQLAQELAEAGRRAYEAEYTEAAVVRHYLDFFAEAADRAPKAGVG
jgi:glycosyltransferase involved in cell wall biosynthesis